MAGGRTKEAEEPESERRQGWGKSWGEGGLKGRGRSEHNKGGRNRIETLLGKKGET